MKRITVQILAQVVDSDGTPVGYDGEVFSRGWKNNLEWVKWRIRASAFCPTAVDAGLRTVFYENYPKDPQHVKCKCHGKGRLVHSRIAIGGIEKEYMGADKGIFEKWKQAHGGAHDPALG